MLLAIKLYFFMSLCTGHVLVTCYWHNFKKANWGDRISMFMAATLFWPLTIPMWLHDHLSGSYHSDRIV